MNFIELARRFAPKTDFTRAVTAVLGGSVLAQAIPIALSPLLTRLFDPGELGVLANYVACLSVLAVIVTGRLELAIMLPKRHTEAFALAIGSIAVAVAMSMLVLVLYSIVDIASLLPRAARHFRAWGYLLPLSLLLVATYQSGSYWLNRRAAYRPLVTVRLVLAGGTGLAQLVAGIAGLGAGGLIVGTVVGQAMACAYIIPRLAAERASFGRRSSIPWLTRVLQRRVDFMRFMVPGQLANVASVYAPVLLLGGLYGSGIVGFYALAERVLFAPNAIIGSAIGDVYRQHASAAFSKDGNCRQLYLRTLAKLAVIGAPPAIAMYLWGPGLFTFVFGETWAPAGEIARLLAVTTFCQTLSTPLSHTVLFAGFQRHEMAWQFLRLVVAGSTIIAGHAVTRDYHVSIRWFAVGLAVMYLTHSFLQFRASGGPMRHA